LTWHNAAFLLYRSAFQKLWWWIFVACWHPLQKISDSWPSNSHKNQPASWRPATTIMEQHQ